MASSGAQIRPGRFLSYSRRDRPSAVSVLPGDSLPAVSLAHQGSDCVHPGALDYADCIGLQFWAGRNVVSTTDRNLDRGFNRLHGAGEHCRRQRSAPVDDRPWFRISSWVWILIRAAAEPAVRGISPADDAALIQRRSRDWTAPGDCAAGTDPGAAVQVCRCRASWNDHSFSSGWAYRLALDARALGTSEAIRLAGVHRFTDREHDALADCDFDICGGAVARKLAQAQGGADP